MRYPGYFNCSILLLLFVGGAWLNGTNAWGINHFSYLPLPYFSVWLGLAFLSFLPAVQKLFSRLFQNKIPDFLFETKFGSLTFTLVMGLAFYSLQGQSYFSGDGYLIIKLLEKGAPFRIFDNMDFFLHSALYQLISDKTNAESLYRFGSVLAGILVLPLLILLLKKLQWQPWRKTLVLLFFVFSGPIVMFFGYIESYAYLYIFITCFLVSSVLVLENKVTILLPSFFLGLAIFFHLSALFCAPALLFLWFKISGRRNWRNFAETILPPILFLTISMIVHHHAGYSLRWLQHDFVDNQNTNAMWLSLTGEDGFFSQINFINQLNLIMLVAPVPFLISLIRIKKIFSRRREPTFQFLLFHLITIGMINLLIDRKLGMARDWDLLIAHSASLFLMAAMVISDPKVFPRKIISIVLTTSFLCTIPWVVLQHNETFSINRFTEVAMGFPAAAKAHAFEDLGQHFRESGNLEKSLLMYDHCIEADPHHYRYYALRGATNFSLARNSRPESAKRNTYTTEALDNYKEALTRNPSDLSSRKNLGKLLLMSGNPHGARVHLNIVLKQTPGDFEVKEILAFCLVTIMEQDISNGQKPKMADYTDSRNLVDSLLDKSPANSKLLSLEKRIDKVGLLL